MSYSVRHQVFVSSTFTDLKEERAEVIQALWELDCIPTGMEAFVASNESQWAVIQRVIDECDYYVLIIGGRYGTVTPEGVSYTEKEYRYAKSIGLPILAFVHGSPEEIPAGKSDLNADQQAKLEAFRSRVMDEYPIRTWGSAAELGGLVSRSLVMAIRIDPRPGWVRNDSASPVALLERVAALSEENAELRNQLSSTSEEPDVSLASGVDAVGVTGTRTIRMGFTSQRQDWSVETDWDTIFKDLGPALLGEASEEALKAILARFNSFDEPPQGYEIVSTQVDHETWSEVLVQLRALNLIDHGVKKRGVNDKGKYWAITSRGDRHLLSLLAQRKGDPLTPDR